MIKLIESNRKRVKPNILSIAMGLGFEICEDDILNWLLKCYRVNRKLSETSGGWRFEWFISPRKSTTNYSGYMTKEKCMDASIEFIFKMIDNGHR